MTCNERFVFFYIYPKTTLTIVCNLTKWEETNMWGCYYFLVGILTVKRTQCSWEGESSYIKQHAFCSAGSFAFWVLGKLSASKYLRSSIFAVLEGKRNPLGGSKGFPAACAFTPSPAVVSCCGTAVTHSRNGFRGVGAISPHSCI